MSSLKMINQHGTETLVQTHECVLHRIYEHRLSTHLAYSYNKSYYTNKKICLLLCLYRAMPNTAYICRRTTCKIA